MAPSSPQMLLRGTGDVRCSGGLALITLLLAQLIGAVIAGPEPLPAKATALVFAAAMVAAGAVLDRGAPASGVPALVGALFRSAGLAVGTALLVVVNAPLHAGLVDVASPAAAVAVLTLTIAGAARLFGAVVGSVALGTLCTIVGLALTSAAPLWLGPAVARLGDPRLVVDTVIGVSPVTYLAVMCDYDYLRSDWLYTTSPVGSVRFDYLAGSTLTGGYLFLAALLFGAHHLLRKMTRG